MFERLGYEPAYVANGREAVDALHLANVDLVLMDVAMPMMEGSSPRKPFAAKSLLLVSRSLLD